MFKKKICQTQNRNMKYLTESQNHPIKTESVVKHRISQNCPFFWPESCIMGKPGMFIWEEKGGLLIHGSTCMFHFTNTLVLLRPKWPPKLITFCETKPSIFHQLMSCKFSSMLSSHNADWTCVETYKDHLWFKSLVKTKKKIHAAHLF